MSLRSDAVGNSSNIMILDQNKDMWKDIDRQKEIDKEKEKDLNSTHIILSN